MQTQSYSALQSYQHGRAQHVALVHARIVPNGSLAEHLAVALALAARAAASCAAAARHARVATRIKRRALGREHVRRERATAGAQC